MVFCLRGSKSIRGSPSSTRTEIWRECPPFGSSVQADFTPSEDRGIPLLYTRSPSESATPSGTDNALPKDLRQAYPVQFSVGKDMNNNDNDDKRFANAIAYIDKINSIDPNMELIKGKNVPAELLYSERMTTWLDTLDGNASEALQLACRCQHIRRWDIPRNNYPMDRKGYLQWRVALGKHHGKVAGEILKEVGYNDEMINRVASLLQKKNLKRDPETQMIEDVSCLVFLEFYFADFAAKHAEEKVINIIQKTWGKMSPTGHRAALKLEFNPSSKTLLFRPLDG